MEKILVPRQNIFALEAKFKKAAKKAAKLGMPIPLLHIFKDEQEIHELEIETFEKVEKRRVVFIPVVFFGEIPIIKGWNLAAAVEHSRVQENEINYNTVRSVPGYDDLVDLRTAPPTCDHCGHNRFRKNTYLLHNSETNEFCRVGSSCVKDFLGDVDPTYIVNSAKHLKFLQTFLDEFERIPGGSYIEEFDIKEVLTITNAVIRKTGWLSRGKVMDTGGFATADYVSEILNTYPANFTHEMKDILNSIDDNDKKMADDSILWLKSFDLNDASLSDYIYNCSLCVKRELITTKDLGIACSIVASYRNKLAKEATQTAEQKVQKDSTFVGEIKERLRNMKVTFLKEWTFDSSWGVCTILKFINEDGNIIIWKTGYVEQFEAGAKMIITGTVKKHENYRDVKQTVLTRCKLEEA